uniref:universal stress protein n=1 Tax=Paenirhodobacter enshiensis TaxID=1105367 RepID=UPI0035AF9DB9
MSDRIIAFVDGSIYSTSVCAYAAWAAGKLGQGVDIVHVTGRRESAAEGLGARSALQAELAALDAQRERLAESRGRAILDDAGAMVRDAGVSDVATELLGGDLLSALSARETGAGIVVVGKRGEAADYAIGHLGSNLERIARATATPVLVAARAFSPVRKVLVAHDGGSVALRAVDEVARSPLFEGTEVIVATVGADTPEVRRRHDDALAVLRAGGLKAESRIVQGQTDLALGTLVEVEGVDMLVMGSYGHSRLRRFFIGSTTEAVLLSCKVPVLLLR